MKIKDRIIAALKRNGGPMTYHALARAVFPSDEYPRSWNRPNRGGPPGCYMALSRAIREHGFYEKSSGYGVVYNIIGLGKNG